jgi:hypothetical protein
MERRQRPLSSHRTTTIRDITRRQVASSSRFAIKVVDPSRWLSLGLYRRRIDKSQCSLTFTRRPDPAMETLAIILRRTWTTLLHGHASVIGLVVDREGGVWISGWFSGQLEATPHPIASRGTDRLGHAVQMSRMYTRGATPSTLAMDPSGSVAFAGHAS